MNSLASKAIGKARAVQKSLLLVAAERITGELAAVLDFYQALRDAPITKAARHERRASRFNAENHATVMLCVNIMRALGDAKSTLTKVRLVRKGLLKEVSDVFDMAEEMAASWPPDEMDDEQERIRALKKEVLGLLRGLQ